MKRHTVTRVTLIMGRIAGILVFGWITLWLAKGEESASGPTGDTLPSNIQKVNPVDGALVAETKGFCVWFLFREGNGMGPDPVSKIKVYLDGANITSQVDVWVDLISPPTYGRLCYDRGQSSNNLLPGWHTAKVIYSDIKYKTFVYTWRFLVGTEDLRMKEIQALQQELQNTNLTEEDRISLEAKLQALYYQITLQAEGINQLTKMPTQAEAALQTMAKTTLTLEEKRYTGIIENPSAPFSASDFVISNAWQEYVDGSYVLVYAGSMTKDPAQGILIVCRDSNHGCRIFVTPQKTALYA